jgi:hypothetical protein
MESQYNNVDTTLDIAGTWNGEAELCNGYVIILVYIKSSKRCTLKVRQSDNKSNYNFIETVEYLPITGEARYQIYRSSLYCYVEVINDSGEVIPDLIVRTHFLNIGRDSSIYYPTVVAGVVDVGNFPATQAVSGSVSIANDVTVKGVNNNFEFFPTATNNTSTVYADGTKGTDVAGGWQYTNQLTGKINWYCYSSAGLATDYKVSQLNSMYTVINQQSTLGLTLAQNPWIMIYTRMDSGTNSGAFFKSKLFFGANAHTDINGLKLLYTGSDPVHIHPEITGINRIQLLFISALSDGKQLADVQNETILAGSLQTTNNSSPVGAFNFTMEEFGIDWVKETVRLPIEFNKVKCDVSGSVALTDSLNTATYNQAVTAVNFTGTAYDMGLNNSLVDVLLYATGTIETGNVRLDFSIDGISWIPNNTTTYSISGTDPHQTIIGLKTGSRYIRVSTGGASGFKASNLQMTFSSKRS